MKNPDSISLRVERTVNNCVSAAVFREQLYIPAAVGDDHGSGSGPGDGDREAAAVPLQPRVAGQGAAGPAGVLLAGAESPLRRHHEVRPQDAVAAQLHRLRRPVQTATHHQK